MRLERSGWDCADIIEEGSGMRKNREGRLWDDATYRIHRRWTLAASPLTALGGPGYRWKRWAREVWALKGHGGSLSR